MVEFREFEQIVLQNRIFWLPDWIRKDSRPEVKPTYFLEVFWSVALFLKPELLKVRNLQTK